jgi:L-glyceraldehyde 3-phosphate reductase
VDAPRRPADERAHLEDNLASVQNLEFSDDELAAIDEHAVEMGINLWESQSDIGV